MTTATGPSKRQGACAVLSQNAAEPLAGTAYTRDSWLLVEHPGPWPSAAVEDILGPGLLEDIRSRYPGIRVTLIRRPGRRADERPDGIAVFSVITGTRPRVRRWRLHACGDLRDLDLSGGDEAGTSPMFVVCTHGRREICCAEFGRPVLRALEGEGVDVWEITHIGGDRFAAAMIAFPHGYYYGRLNPVTAVDAARAYCRGRLARANLRGLSGVPNPAQVADLEVRERWGLDAVDDVRFVRSEEQEDRATVDLVAAGTPCRVDLVRRDHPEQVVNGCAPDAQRIVRRVWDVVDVVRDGPADSR